MQLSAKNIKSEIELLREEIESFGHSLHGKIGFPLLHYLKRGTTGNGRYTHVSPFEAANRLMSDLVILEGIAFLMENKAVFPFNEYTVQLGNKNSGPFDISANFGDSRLAGEAFNVAPSFFPSKKSASQKSSKERVVSRTAFSFITLTRLSKATTQAWKTAGIT